MDTTILPIKDPPIRCYLFEAYPLSIMAQADDYLPWFYGNYIQVSAFTDQFMSNALTVDFFERRQAFKSPWLTVQRFSWMSLAAEDSGITGFITGNIDRGCCFYGYIDEFYIANRRAYRSHKFVHDIMIYGYDPVKQTLFAVGFDDTMCYASSEIGYSEFEDAFRNNNRDKSIYYWEDEICLCKYNEEASFLPDLKATRELLCDYLFSRNSYERLGIINKQTNRLFGLEVYVLFKNYLESLAGGKAHYDIRALYCIMEHKKVMLARLLFFRDNAVIDCPGELIDSYAVIADKFSTFVNQMLKYRLTGKVNLLKGILDALDPLVKDEHRILNRVLSKMDEKLESR